MGRGAYGVGWVTASETLGVGNGEVCVRGVGAAGADRPARASGVMGPRGGRATRVSISARIPCRAAVPMDNEERTSVPASAQGRGESSLNPPPK